MLLANARERAMARTKPDAFEGNDRRARYLASGTSGTVRAPRGRAPPRSSYVTLGCPHAAACAVRLECDCRVGCGCVRFGNVGHADARVAARGGGGRHPGPRWIRAVGERAAAGGGTIAGSGQCHDRAPMLEAPGSPGRLLAGGESVRRPIGEQALSRMKESGPREGMVVNRTALLSVAGEPVARVDGIMKPGGLLVHIRMGMFARGNSVLMLSAYALPGEDADNGRTFESHLQ